MQQDDEAFTLASDKILPDMSAALAVGCRQALYMFRASRVLIDKTHDDFLMPRLQDEVFEVLAIALNLGDVVDVESVCFLSAHTSSTGRRVHSRHSLLLSTNA